MIKRTFWVDRIEKAWEKRSVIWLAGVRRAGKTVLCQSLDAIEYFDCEKPRTRERLEDPETFLDALGPRRIVLDEIHRLENPSQLLKIAADHYPNIRILATGSSTLASSTKFKDTLTGRKTNLWLTPMNHRDLKDFDGDLSNRLLKGGLPAFYLSPHVVEAEFQEWMDDYWAKDIQELFRLERRASFLKFAQLLFLQSGGLFEATAFARPCEISRPTIMNYLSVLEETFVAHVVRPFSSHKPTEIVAAPKVYGFDTGFVAYFRGWETLRQDDKGPLWEHIVLNEFHSLTQGGEEIRYWRDKQDHEVDFIWSRRGRPPVAIECKWSSGKAGAENLSYFRKYYPAGENWVVAADVKTPYQRKLGPLTVQMLGLEHLPQKLSERI
jgi:predicted AAA+ superfamily ATPase